MVVVIMLSVLMIIIVITLIFTLDKVSLVGSLTWLAVRTLK